MCVLNKIPKSPETLDTTLKVPYYEKHVFSSLDNLSSLSLPTPRMRKTNKSCMVSAAHPLVRGRSYWLFRFSSCCYVTKGEMFIDRPPLRDDRRYV